MLFVLLLMQDSLIDIITEGDSLCAISAFQNHEDGLASAWAIVADVLRIGQSCTRLSFSFVEREGNSVAHALVKNVKSVSDFVVWLEDPPGWLDGLLTSDYSDI